jgi:hypothetical protein
VSIALNTYAATTRFAPGLPPKPTYLDLDPATVQAVWRCMLGGNDHWVNYYNSDRSNKYSGINDQQAALGRITQSGKDYRHRAGEPYDFTPEVIDAKRLAFGFWTRNGDPKHPLYSFLAFDFEPLKQPSKRPGPEVPLTPAGRRIESNPTLKHRQRVYREAQDCYDSLVNCFLDDDRILAVSLVESSRDHYHVAAIPSRHLSRDEHDAIITTIHATNRPFKNLDKDSSRAKQGLGDQFRAPGCWKHGARAQWIKWYCTDEDQLIARGASLRPPGLRFRRRKSAFDNPIKDPTDQDTLLAWAIRQYPITSRTRNDLQFKLIRDLLHRRIDSTIIRAIGPRWLQHFNNQEETSDPECQN